MNVCKKDGVDIIKETPDPQESLKRFITRFIIS